MFIYCRFKSNADRSDQWLHYIGINHYFYFTKCVKKYLRLKLEVVRRSVCFAFYQFLYDESFLRNLMTSNIKFHHILSSNFGDVMWTNRQVWPSHYALPTKNTWKVRVFVFWSDLCVNSFWCVETQIVCLYPKLGEQRGSLCRWEIL